MTRVSFSMLFGLLYLAPIAAGCGDEEPAGETVPVLELTASAAPSELGDVDATFYSGVPYGPHAENVFDLFMPNVDAPTPLVVFIHGGGFVAYERTEAYEELWRHVPTQLLAEDVAFATIDYRLIQDVDTEGILKPLGDAARALQFIRYHHEQFNIDPDRVVLTGNSAGAGTSMWIAFSDDMADPSSDDPVLRQSTRVSGVVAEETQATYDLEKWTTVVFASLNLDFIEAVTYLEVEQRVNSLFGMAHIDEFDSEEILAYRARVDLLDLMTIDDPPLFVRNQYAPDQVPTDLNIMFHHVNHALSLADRAAAIGLEHVLYAPTRDIEDPSGETDVAFMLRMLGEQ